MKQRETLLHYHLVHTYASFLYVTPKVLLFLQLQESHPMLTNDELEMHTVSVWKYGKLQMHAEVSGTLIPPNRRVLQVCNILCCWSFGLPSFFSYCYMGYSCLSLEVLVGFLSLLFFFFFW